MKKNPTKVYIPVKVEDAVNNYEGWCIAFVPFEGYQYGRINRSKNPQFKSNIDNKIKNFSLNDILQQKQLITFTPREFNQFLEDFGKELLQKAAENSKMTGIAYGNDTSISDYEVDKNSILEVLPKVLEKYKI